MGITERLSRMEDILETKAGEPGRGVAIRMATPADAAALLAVYAPYVERTAVSFEWAVPGVEEFRARIASTLARYPYLVAEADGVPVGYAYAGVFKPRAAYRHCVETSVYVCEDFHGRGVGRALYAELERRLKAQGIRNLNACIAWIDEPDEYLTHGSPAFHARLGFVRVAHFHRCGYKFGRWYDMIWMEKLLDPQEANAGCGSL